MAHLCTKCDTLYHTEKEWSYHNQHICLPHSTKHSLSLPDAHKESWDFIERVLKVDPIAQDIIREFREASTIAETKRIRDKFIKYIQDKHREP